MSRKSLLCGAALAVLTAGPALAQGTMVYSGPPAPGSSFYGSTLAAQVEVGLGGIFFGKGDSLGVFNGVGRIGAPLSGGWRTQIDAFGAGVFQSGGYASGLGGAIAHFYTEPGQGAVGVFAGGALAEGSPLVVVGAEAAHYWTQSVLKGSVSYTFVTQYSDANFFTLAASYSYYPNPNGRVGLYTSFSSGNDSGSLFRLGVEGDMMLPCEWVSLGGRIGLVSYSNGSSETGVEALGRLSFYSWGHAPLWQQDKALPWRDSTISTVMAAY